MDERKRLKLLPEILPAPTRGASESGPRTRTREHMQRLLAAAALTGALAACKTDPGYGVVDPMPAPADASGPPIPPTPPTLDAARSPPPPQQVPYGVVDPLPMPARDAGPPAKDAGPTKKDAGHASGK